jgi:hypothetical protein
MDLEKLELPEIKSLCKKYGVGTVGNKKELIKKLKYYTEPVEGTINTHPNRKLPTDKKIVAIKISEKEKLSSILKNKSQFLYYSFGYHYYLVSKDLNV